MPKPKSKSKFVTHLTAYILMVVGNDQGRYGASVVDELTDRHSIRAHRSHIYSRLHALVAQGLLVAEWRQHPTGQGPNRKLFYRRTPWGNDALRAYRRNVRKV